MTAKSEASPSSYRETLEREVFSIPEWCRLIGISRAFFYKLSPDQRPTVIKLGRRSLITRRASTEWQDRMTQRAES